MNKKANILGMLTNFIQLNIDSHYNNELKKSNLDYYKSNIKWLVPYYSECSAHVALFLYRNINLNIFKYINTCKIYTTLVL